MRTKAKGKRQKVKVSKRGALLVLTFAFYLFTSALPARAQDDPPPPPKPAAQQKEDGIETVRIDTDLVDLNVSVFSRDRRNQAGGLQQKDFAVMENGRPEEISFFASAETPFDLVLLIDLSGSTAEKLDLIRKSAVRFVEATRPVDRIGIVTFTDVPLIVSPITTDRQELKERIKKIDKPSGGTNFWDALGFTLRGVLGAKSEARRQAVVVMTDGVDNALPDVPGPGSAISFDDLLNTIKRSDAIVIPIYLDTEREEIKKHRAVESAYITARQQLALIAEESGSLLYNARKLEDLKGVYEQVIRDLGMVYSIGYRPTNRERDGSWRNVEVHLVNHPELLARTRRGYYAK